jgi:thiosulfate/3-mercaptopyruvate sulfurtransferase
MSDNSILIDAIDLNTLLKQANANPADGHVVLIDCRHDLMNHSAGIAAFNSGHIPSAQFWNMETDAVSEHTGLNGRHPLASREQTRACFERFGVTNSSRLVVYDAHGGQYAGRLWWLARWIGHQNVSLLDGGLPAWQAAGFELSNDKKNHNPTVSPLQLRPALVSWIDKHQVALVSKTKSSQVLDARAPARFRGEVEPIDPVAGHIPGALNRFYQDNLTSQGLFKSNENLRAEFNALLGARAPSEIVHQCGSGVTACHNLIAMELAGLSGGTLYPGSWSEWCADPALPVATGA